MNIQPESKTLPKARNNSLFKDAIKIKRLKTAQKGMNDNKKNQRS